MTHMMQQQSDGQWGLRIPRGLPSPVFTVPYTSYLINLPCALWGGKAHYPPFGKCGNRDTERLIDPWWFNESASKPEVVPVFQILSLLTPRYTKTWLNRMLFSLYHYIMSYIIYHVILDPSLALNFSCDLKQIAWSLRGYLQNGHNPCPACPIGLSWGLYEMIIV